MTHQQRHINTTDSTLVDSRTKPPPPHPAFPVPTDACEDSAVLLKPTGGPFGATKVPAMADGGGGGVATKAQAVCNHVRIETADGRTGNDPKRMVKGGRGGGVGRGIVLYTYPTHFTNP